jgi:hypothetical protein
VLTEGSVALLYTYTAISALILLLHSRAGTGRPLHWLLWVNFGVAALYAVFVTRSPSSFDALNPMGNSREELFILVVLAATYSVTVEVPGFLINSSRDKKLVGLLSSVELALLETKARPSKGIPALKELLTKHGAELKELGLAGILNGSLECFERLNNVDAALAGVALSAVQRASDYCSERPKHPLPLLAELLGLAGVTFILGEILAAIRGR